MNVVDAGVFPKLNENPVCHTLQMYDTFTFIMYDLLQNVTPLTLCCHFHYVLPTTKCNTPYIMYSIVNPSVKMQHLLHYVIPITECNSQKGGMQKGWEFPKGAILYPILHLSQYHVTGGHTGKQASKQTSKNQIILGKTLQGVEGYSGKDPTRC
jgi:hypothetical protein